MIISYRYSIFPCREAERKLEEALDTCRWLYNRLLEELNKARDSGKALSTRDTQNLIPLLKPEYPPPEYCLFQGSSDGQLHPA